MSPYPQILVAEDESSEQCLLRRAVEKSGLQVEIQFVRNGLEVVEYLQSRGTPLRPALLLLDLNMPDMGGFEVLEWLRQHDELRPDYVAILSGSYDGNDLQRASLLGVDHYLVKPGDPSELAATLKRLEPYWGRLKTEHAELAA